MQATHIEKKEHLSNSNNLLELVDKSFTPLADAINATNEFLLKEDQFFNNFENFLNIEIPKLREMLTLKLHKKDAEKLKKNIEQLDKLLDPNNMLVNLRPLIPANLLSGSLQKKDSAAAILEAKFEAKIEELHRFYSNNDAKKIYAAIALANAYNGKLLSILHSCSDLLKREEYQEDINKILQKDKDSNYEMGQFFRECSGVLISSVQRLALRSVTFENIIKSVPKTSSKYSKLEQMITLFKQQGNNCNEKMRSNFKNLTRLSTQDFYDVQSDPFPASLTNAMADTLHLINHYLNTPQGQKLNAHFQCPKNLNTTSIEEKEAWNLASNIIKIYHSAEYQWKRIDSDHKKLIDETPKKIKAEIEQTVNNIREKMEQGDSPLANSLEHLVNTSDNSAVDESENNLAILPHIISTQRNRSADTALTDKKLMQDFVIQYVSNLLLKYNEITADRTHTSKNKQEFVADICSSLDALYHKKPEVRDQLMKDCLSNENNNIGQMITEIIKEHLNHHAISYKLKKTMIQSKELGKIFEDLIAFLGSVAKESPANILKEIIHGESISKISVLEALDQGKSHHVIQKHGVLSAVHSPVPPTPVIQEVVKANNVPTLDQHALSAEETTKLIARVLIVADYHTNETHLRQIIPALDALPLNTKQSWTKQINDLRQSALQTYNQLQQPKSDLNKIHENFNEKITETINIIHNKFGGASSRFAATLYDLDGYEPPREEDTAVQNQSSIELQDLGGSKPNKIEKYRNEEKLPSELRTKCRDITPREAKIYIEKRIIDRILHIWEDHAEANLTRIAMFESTLIATDRRERQIRQQLILLRDNDEFRERVLASDKNGICQFIWTTIKNSISVAGNIDEVFFKKNFGECLLQTHQYLREIDASIPVSLQAHDLNAALEITNFGVTIRDVVRPFLNYNDIVSTRRHSSAQKQELVDDICISFDALYHKSEKQVNEIMVACLPQDKRNIKQLLIEIVKEHLNNFAATPAVREAMIQTGELKHIFDEVFHRLTNGNNKKEDIINEVLRNTLANKTSLVLAKLHPDKISVHNSVAVHTEKSSPKAADKLSVNSQNNKEAELRRLIANLLMITDFYTNNHSLHQQGPEFEKLEANQKTRWTNKVKELGTLALESLTKLQQPTADLSSIHEELADKMKTTVKDILFWPGGSNSRTAGTLADLSGDVALQDKFMNKERLPVTDKFATSVDAANRYTEKHIIHHTLQIWEKFTKNTLAHWSFFSHIPVVKDRASRQIMHDLFELFNNDQLRATQLANLPANGGSQGICQLILTTISKRLGVAGVVDKTLFEKDFGDCLSETYGYLSKNDPGIKFQVDTTPIEEHATSAPVEERASSEAGYSL